MRKPISLRNHYHPIQPSVSPCETDIAYHECAPSTETENLVYCFWQLKTLKPLADDYLYRVVSDGCIDVFFDRNRPSDTFVMGFCRKFVEFPIGKEFDYIGVRFFPSAFPHLFGVHAQALSNQSQELHNVAPELAEWIAANIAPSHAFETIAKLLDAKISSVSKAQPGTYDQRFADALMLIFQKSGNVDVENDLTTGLSPRQLRRIFNFYIGTTAKSFSNVVRFQYILRAKPSAQSLKDNKLYFDVGFFDQAHFIKSFKTYYGVTPSEAFR